MTSPSKRKRAFLLMMICLFTAFLTWRMIRPMNIFGVGDDFALPMVMTIPEGLDSLLASQCGVCHSAIYQEWQGSMHAKAWTDPYYQVDLVFDGSQQVCLNCHIPLQNQQKHLVLGFKDKKRFKPILKPNLAFNEELQQEGVTCVVCHVRDGIIIGPYGDTDAPHPSRYDEIMTSSMGICEKCHVVSGESWDTFYRIPPCGTVAEIGLDKGPQEINCVECHMPAVVRPVSDGSPPRGGRMHLWRGGHDQETVRNALKVDLKLNKLKDGNGNVQLTLTNIGADHFLPTGTPDRHLTVEFLLEDKESNVFKSKIFKLKRTIMWRPFIIDLADSRLQKDKPRSYSFKWTGSSNDDDYDEVVLDVTVRYHLLDEARRKRIKYANKEPISYILYHYQTSLIQ